MKAYRSFLVINPFGIGDVLFATPLLRNLKEQVPGCRIYFLCNKRTEPILKNDPLIEKIFVYERDDFAALRKVSSLTWLKQYLRFFSEIRREKIDVAIDLSLHTKFGLFAFLAGIRRRVGLDFKRRGWLLTDKIKTPSYRDRHVAEYYLKTLGPLGLHAQVFPMAVYAEPEARAWAGTFLLKSRIHPEDLIVGIAPCGGQAFGPQAYMKRWPLAHFIGLIRELQKKRRAWIFLFAGKDEKTEVRQILQAVDSARCFEFTDASLQEIVALVERCYLFIGNDTGPMRFADAFQKRTVALFGPVDERVYGPYPYESSRHRVLWKTLPCRPCYRDFRLPPCPYDLKCLREISVEEAFSAAEQLLENA